MADQRPMTLREQIARRREMLADPSNAVETAPSSTRAAPPAKPKKKKKKKPEAAGVGRDFSQTNAARLGARLRAQIEAVDDPDLKAELQQRLKMLTETVQ